MLELRGYKDVIAFRKAGQAPWAFHARNLEVAEVSTEVWDSLPSTSLTSTSMPEILSTGEAGEEIRDWEESESSEVSSRPLAFGIRSLTINVTQICNLHCSYCAAGGDGTYGEAIKKISIEKTLPQIKFFLEQLKPGSRFHIAFLGGEPLLYPEALKAISDYTKELAALKQITVSFKITTNGTRLTEKNIRVLNDIGLGVVISLDGPESINDKRRADKFGRGSTKLIIEGLQRLALDRKNISYIELHAVMDPQHYDVEQTYDFFHTLPVDRFEFTFSVSDTTSTASQLFVESYEKAAAKAFLRGGEKELRRFSLFNQYFSILDRQERIENHCGLGKTLAVVDAKNRLFNCPWTVGDEKNQIGADLDLNYDRLQKYSKSLVEMNNCQTCWARFLCGGGCSFIHDSVDGTNLNKKNDFCFRTRYLSALVFKYFLVLRSEAQNFGGINGQEKGDPHGRKEAY